MIEIKSVGKDMHKITISGSMYDLSCETCEIIEKIVGTFKENNVTDSKVYLIMIKTLVDRLLKKEDQ